MHRLGRKGVGPGARKRALGVGGREVVAGSAEHGDGLSAYADLFGADQLAQLRRPYDNLVFRYGRAEADHIIKQHIRRALLERLAKK